MAPKRTLKRLMQKYIKWDKVLYIMHYDKNTDFPVNEISIDGLLVAMQSKIKMISKILFKRLNFSVPYDDVFQEVNIMTLKLLTVYDCKKSAWKTFWNNKIIPRTMTALTIKKKCYINREEKYAEKINREADNGDRKL
jgi:hypothetical protein